MIWWGKLDGGGGQTMRAAHTWKMAKKLLQIKFDKHKKRAQGDGKNKHKGNEGKTDKKKWQSVPAMTGWVKGPKRNRGRRRMGWPAGKMFYCCHNFE